MATAYVYEEVGIGVLTGASATNSATYAQDHANLLAQYGFKELTTSYIDSLATKRPCNISYCKGPVNLSSGLPNFESLWAIFSPINSNWTEGVLGGVYAHNISLGTLYDLREVYPAYASELSGTRGIISGAFDMSGTPVVALEADDHTITSWRAVEGLVSWTGYSPMVLCNRPWTRDENPDNLLYDAVVLYTKDVSGVSSVWNYDTARRRSEQTREDHRAGRTLFARFQRNNFGVEYTLLTTDFDMAYIENAWFDGDPNTYDPATDFGREYCLYVSVRDHSNTRHTFKSANYYYTNKYPIDVPEDTAAMSSSIVGGELFETVLVQDAVVEVSSISASIDSGSLYDTVISVSNEETASISAAIDSGSLEEQVIAPSMVTETSSIDAAVYSGALEDVTVSSGDMVTETAAMSASIVSGALESV